MKLVEKAIYEMLSTLASGHVYAARAPDGSNGPFIIFQRTDSQRWRAINNPSGVAQCFIQVDCYAPGYYEAKELGADVEDILDGFRGTVSYGEDSPQETVVIGGISLQNDFDLLDQTDQPLLFRNSASYLVTYHQR